MEWKEIWSIHLETSLEGWPFDGFEFYWQTVTDSAGSMADKLIIGNFICSLAFDLNQVSQTELAFCVL